MSGGRSPKRKGTRVERELVQLLCELGLPCVRVPLSGAIGGSWAGDIHLELHGRTHKVEVKARREFRTLHSWLADKDVLVLKADRQAPLAVLPVSLLVKLIVRS
jgi:Holliday junction resolvase